VYLFHSSKGGNGTTLVTVACALAEVAQRPRAVLVDLCGDVPAMLGMAEPVGPGVNDWLAENSTADTDTLLHCGTTVADGLLVVHRGAEHVEGSPRWALLAATLATLPVPVFVDAGIRLIGDDMAQRARRTILVTKPCYLSLRRATMLRRPSHVVVVNEQGRALTSKDVESVLAAPVIATIPIDPAVSRAVDAGLFPARCTQLLGKHLPSL